MQQNERLTDKSTQPTDAILAEWLGDKAYGFWTRITGFIDQNYPGIFTPDWLFGGKKHGWCLRFKKSKSFCTLIPEKENLAVLIVFGAQEREKAEAILSELSPEVRKDYESATTYHDGKWLLINMDSEEALVDTFRLLQLKRKPKKSTIC
jgi:hypothetical protein